MNEFSHLIYAGLETAINQYLALDPLAYERMQRLDGKVIGFDFRGIDVSLYLVPSVNQLMVLADHERPDCVIEGTPWSLARMSDSQASSQSLFAGEVTISGSTALAHEFGQFLASIDIDWEEHLAHIAGDLIAYQVMGRWRKYLVWKQAAGYLLGQDVDDYLHETVAIVPAREDVTLFLHDVDYVRDDVERLAARVQRLQVLRKNN